MSRFEAQNQWRLLKIECLFAAVADKDENATETAISSLLIPADRASDYGFRTSDYSWYANRYQSRIDGFDRPDGSRRFGLQESVLHKMTVVGRCNERLSRSTGEDVKKILAKRDEIYTDINEIKSRIAAETRVITILRDLATKYDRAPGRIDAQAMPTAVKQAA